MVSLLMGCCRTASLENLSYRVIRFRNEDVFGDLGPVLDRIRIAISRQS
jgi:very-short-patch-repair endonuclease